MSNVYLHQRTPAQIKKDATEVSTQRDLLKYLRAEEETDILFTGDLLGGYSSPAEFYNRNYFEVTPSKDFVGSFIPTLEGRVKSRTLFDGYYFRTDCKTYFTSYYHLLRAHAVALFTRGNPDAIKFKSNESKTFHTVLFDYRNDDVKRDNKAVFLKNVPKVSIEIFPRMVLKGGNEIGRQYWVRSREGTVESDAFFVDPFIIAAYWRFASEEKRFDNWFSYDSCPFPYVSPHVLRTWYRSLNNLVIFDETISSNKGFRHAKIPEVNKIMARLFGQINLNEHILNRRDIDISSYFDIDLTQSS